MSEDEQELSINGELSIKPEELCAGSGHEQRPHAHRTSIQILTRMGMLLSQRSEARSSQPEQHEQQEPQQRLLQEVPHGLEMKQSGTLKLHLSHGVGLKPMNDDGSSNPWVKITLGTTEVSSRFVRGTLDPEWSQ